MRPPTRAPFFNEALPQTEPRWRVDVADSTLGGTAPLALDHALDARNT